MARLSTSEQRVDVTIGPTLVWATYSPSSESILTVRHRSFNLMLVLSHLQRKLSGYGLDHVYLFDGGCESGFREHVYN